MAKSKSAIRIQDAALDEAKSLAALKAGTADNLIVGMLLGVALDYTERSDVLGGKVEGFSGQFRIMPNGGEALQSGALFLPPQFHKPIADALNAVMYPNPDKPDKKARGVAVRFAADIAMLKKGDGYDWGLRFTRNPESIDPLADLEKQVVGSRSSEVQKAGTAAVADALKTDAKPDKTKVKA